MGISYIRENFSYGFDLKSSEYATYFGPVLGHGNEDKWWTIGLMKKLTGEESKNEFIIKSIIKSKFLLFFFISRCNFSLFFRNIITIASFFEINSKIYNCHFHIMFNVLVIDALVFLLRSSRLQNTI